MLWLHRLLRAVLLRVCNQDSCCYTIALVVVLHNGTIFIEDTLNTSPVIKTQVIEECHSAVKQTVRNPVFTRDSATYERTDSNGDQHWTVSGRVTGTNTSGKTGTFEWSCTATHIDKNGLVDAWSSVETTPVR